MNPEDELTDALRDGYERAGHEVGYWGRRFLRSVNTNGGLATAKRLLRPTASAATRRTKGFIAMLEANRPDLTLEAIVLDDRFSSLFTADELQLARERLGEFAKQANLYPEELESRREYVEGARRQICVNAYERDPRARQDCLKHYGYACTVCGFSFEQVYGDLGRDFIHVHHLKPLALCDPEYTLSPVDDLRPVCPNCHGMLHHSGRVLTIEELQARLVPRHSGPAVVS